MKYYYVFLGMLFAISCFPQAAGSNTCYLNYLSTQPADYNYVDNQFVWKLIFEDNFDGNSLDASKWDNLYGWCARSLGTGEQEYYTDNQNILISNGTLKITAKNEYVVKPISPCSPDNQIMSDGIQNLRSFNYTSGMVSSKTNFSYGKYEIMCKIPTSSGAWPAFWTFGGTPSGGQSEIDCFEFYGSNMNRQGTNLHTNGVTSCGQDINGSGFTSSFHKYSVVYTPLIIEWYRDDVLIRHVNKYTYVSPFDASDPGWLYVHTGQYSPINPGYYVTSAWPEDGSWMRIIANLAVENGAWPLTFPGTFEIDYIKYYQKRPCTSSALNMSAATLYTTLNNYTTYHTISGNDLNIFDATISTGQQLKLGACNTIAITSEFAAADGSNFISEADSKYCCTPDPGYRMNLQDSSFNPNPDLLSSGNYIKSKTRENDKAIVNADQLNVFFISPNPSNGQFTVNTNNPNEKQLSVFNSLGLLVYTNKINSETYKLNLDLASGIYFVEINTNGIKQQQKIIIEK